MKSFLKVIIPVGIILFLLLLQVMPSHSPQEQIGGLPWQIETLADGSSRALGIHLGEDNLKDAVRLLGRPEGLALFSPQTEARDLSLEAYFGTVRNGPLAAKLILVLTASQEQMRAMAERAITRKPGPSGAYQWTLSEADKQQVLAYRIRALTYIPLYAKLEPEFFSSRFGQPSARQTLDKQRERWLYPEQGLSIDINPEGQEVLHYVAPRDFVHPGPG
ncbi:MAG: hypothetical protein H7842_10140 [Gammaproteobacteria bacterium SHHR-1]|uniref:hypothetical protein n=1 Tax=Magnetovirga frankeli TaxID=947516 RepID=UPI00129392A1|nr:hypothetical protein D5125_04740 [gamma proteobacterium SS-5]